MEIQNFEYLWNKKGYLDEIKSIFYSFLGAIILWKKWKIAGTSFKYFPEKKESEILKKGVEVWCRAGLLKKGVAGTFST